VDFGVQKLLSVKRGKIGPRLLLMTNTKSPARFRLVPKSKTVDNVKGYYFIFDVGRGVCLGLRPLHPQCYFNCECIFGRVMQEINKLK